MLPKANSTVKKEVCGTEHLPGTAPHHVRTAALGCPAAQVYRAARAFWEGMGLERPRLHSLRKNGLGRARLSTVPLRPIKDKGLFGPLRAARGTFPPHPSYPKAAKEAQSCTATLAAKPSLRTASSVPTAAT